MSQLKNKRRAHSKGDFVNYAYDIYSKTVEFLVHLSPRYGRVYIENTVRLAHKVYDEAEIAQKTYTSDADRIAIRKRHLLEARGALSALDTKLTDIYRVLLKNPQGAFTTGNGKKIPKEDAERKLENLADELGVLIDLEDAALSGVLESDQRALKNLK